MSSGAGASSAARESSAPRAPADGARLLVIEDDADLRASVAASLASRGYVVRDAGNAREGMTAWETNRPDIVLLDLGLPDQDGLTVIKRIRREASTPILILSARHQEEDRVEALELGADDYLTKPFGVPELVARIRALLRRAAGPGADTGGLVKVGGLTLDVANHLVTIDGLRVDLTPREFEVLKVLVSHAGRLVTHGRLLRAVWGTAYGDESHYTHVYVSQIRRKLAAADPTGRTRSLIVAEPGVGYRISEG
jgi:two-component system KDP operon response regulator KdpE